MIYSIPFLKPCQVFILRIILLSKSNDIQFSITFINISLRVKTQVPPLAPLPPCPLAPLPVK